MGQRKFMERRLCMNDSTNIMKKVLIICVAITVLNLILIGIGRLMG